jgi:hypothetical protein
MVLLGMVDVASLSTHLVAVGTLPHLTTTCH